MSTYDERRAAARVKLEHEAEVGRHIILGCFLFLGIFWAGVFAVILALILR